MTEPASDPLRSAGEFLMERLGNVRAELRAVDGITGSGWGADCPVCDPPTRFFLDRLYRIAPCQAGHDAGEIMEAIAPSREPGEDDDVETPETMSVGVADFFATCKDRIEWLLEPYVSAGSFTIIQGAPKSGKTWLAAWISVACAAHAKVLFVEEEGAAEVLRDRLKPFLADAAAFNSNLLVAFRKRVKLDITKSVDALIEEVCRTGASLVVLDPFIALHSKREKESDEMAVVLSAIRQLITETGCAVLLLHHTRKGESWNKGSSADASSEDSRGSGAVIGDVDHVIAVKALPASKRKDGEVAFYVENPDTRLGAPFAKKLVIIDLATGSSRELDAAAADDPAAKAAALLARILPLLPVSPAHISRNKLREALRVRKDAMLEAVDLGVKQGRIIDHVIGISVVVPGTSAGTSGTSGTGNGSVVPVVVPIGNHGNNRNRGDE